MNISLKNRVTASFVIVNVVVLILGFTVFFFLESLNKEIESITKKSNKIELITDQVRISAVQILKAQRQVLINRPTRENVDRIKEQAEGFTTQLQQLESLHTDAKLKSVIATMLTYVDSLKLVVSKASLFHRDTVGIASIGDLADKILESFTNFQKLQRDEAKKRDAQLKKIISETKKTMMITLICTFLGTILLGLIIPGSIALPFKKINDAIRELQECNFDVSIFYDKDDEIGEMSREMNKMIQSMKKFEELRTDRILVENKKFDTLASLTKRYVLVANAKGELIYMNNRLYSLLGVSSDDVLHKSISDIKVPPSISETYQLAIKRRTKIENAEIEIVRKKELEEGEETSAETNGTNQEGPENEAEAKEQENVEVVFSGYGNVVPIRGKDSSLDYYLMVLSSEIFS